MPTPPYSTRFLGQVLTVGTSATYTVPTGRVAVVRSIDLVAAGGAATAVAQSGSVTLVGVTLAAALASLHWEGRQVVNAGQTISVSSIVGTTHATVSGYLLTV